MPRSRGRRTDYTWTQIPSLRTSFSAVGTTAISGSLSTSLSATIMRCRSLGFLCMFDATQQVGDEAFITVGLGIVPTDAVGSATLPDPDAEPGYPWLWWGAFGLRSELAVGINNLGCSVYRSGAIDSKAMRRWKPNQSLVWVAEITSVAGAPVMLFDMPGTRILVGQ